MQDTTRKTMREMRKSRRRKARCPSPLNIFFFMGMITALMRGIPQVIAEPAAVVHNGSMPLDNVPPSDLFSAAVAPKHTAMPDSILAPGVFSLIPPEYLSYLEEKNEAASFLEMVRENRKILRETILPCLFSQGVLEWIRLQKQQIPIVFVPERFMEEEGVKAMYRSQRLNPEGAPLSIVLRVSLESTYEMQYEGLSTLRNEFFHYLCELANREKSIPAGEEVNCINPFIQATGQVDRSLYQKFKKAVHAVFEKIEEYRQILQLEYRQRSASQQKELLKLDAVLRMHYRPLLRKKIFPRAGYMYLFSGKMLSVRSQNGEIRGFRLVQKEGTYFLETGTAHSNSEESLSQFKIEDTLLQKDGDVALYVSYAGKNPVEGFLSDFYYMQQMYYDAPLYASKEREGMYFAERASGISMFHPEILRVIAAPFCAYMEAYIGLEKGAYCGDMPAGCAEKALHQHTAL